MNIKHRRPLPQVLLALTVLAALMLAVLFNGIFLLLSNRHNLALDLTRTGAYQLDPESIQLLSELQVPVSMKVLATADSFEGNPYLVQARQILEQYPKHNNLVDLTFIDYASNPSFAAAYPDLDLKPGNILVSAGDSLTQLTLNELFNYTYSPTAASGTSVASSRAQEAISAAIFKVTSTSPLKAALLTGADTAQAPAFISLLKDNNYTLSQVNLVSDHFTDVDLLILLAPMVDLSLHALEKLDAFLYNDGKYQKTLLYFMDASQPALPNISAFLGEWGALPLDGAVFETNANRSYRMQPYYPLADYADEAMKNSLRDSSNPMLMPRARPFSLLYAARDNQQTRTLLAFSETSGVRPSLAGSDFTPAQAQVKGPLPALAILRRNSKGQDGGSSSIILSASTAMLEESALANTQLANTEYLLQLLDQQTGREAGIKVRPVSLAGAYLGVGTATARWLGILLMAVLPGMLLLIGLATFLYRRYQ